MGSLQKMSWILLITTIVVAGFIFSTQNSNQVTIQFATWASRPVPVALTLFLSFGLGFFLSYLSAVLQMLRLRSNLKKAQKMIENLEKEIHVLRNQPILEELNVTSKPRPLTDRTFPPVPRKFQEDTEDYGLEDFN